MSEISENKKYLEVGVVQNVHGVSGDLTVSCLCDSTDVFRSLKRIYVVRGGKYDPCELSRNTRHREGVMLVHIDGFDSRETAACLKGVSLYADRSDLPSLKEGSYYIADLLGLDVIDAGSGKIYGKITDVSSYGASDVYEITDECGNVRLFPAVPEFIEKTDLEHGLFINPIEGMFS